MEDMVSTNANQKSKKLYNEMFSRNRLNKEQIDKFQAKTDDFHEKVKKFKEMMLNQSRKLQQAVIIRSSPKIVIEEKKEEA